jgi:hypothetical protein
MFPHADTYYAAVEAERTLALKRAERRALLAEAARRPRSVRQAPARVAVVHAGRLACAVRSLHRVFRPAHAWPTSGSHSRSPGLIAPTGSHPATRPELG